jgi:hypothetical protein
MTFAPPRAQLLDSKGLHRVDAAGSPGRKIGRRQRHDEDVQATNVSTAGSSGSTSNNKPRSMPLVHAANPTPSAVPDEPILLLGHVVPL